MPIMKGFTARDDAYQTLYAPSTAIPQTDVQRAIDYVASLIAASAPGSAEYIVAATDATLTAERVATNTSRISWSFATPGQALADLITDSVDNTFLANMAQGTIKGRAAGGGTGDPQDLSAAQVGTILGLPTSSTDNAIVRFDGTGGAFQNSGVLIDDSNNILLPAATALNWASSATTLTQGTTSDGSANSLIFQSATAAAGLELRLNNNGTSGPYLLFNVNSASPAIGDDLGTVSFTGRDSAGNYTYYADFWAEINDPTNGSEDSVFLWGGVAAGAYVQRMGLNHLALYPVSNDGLALGGAGFGWSDAFFANGGVLNFNSGQLTLTQSSSALFLSGTGAAGLNITGVGNANIELGRTDGTSSTPFIDFHSGTTAVDYDYRIIASGGTGVTGNGVLTFTGASATFGAQAVTVNTLELGNNTDTTLARSASGIATIEGNVIRLAGKETIWVPAAAMITRTTNGAATGTVELATNRIMLRTFDFDATTQEFVQFQIGMPKSWNEGTISAQFFWSHNGGANFGVVWALEAVAVSDDDALDTAFGTAQQVADTGGTTNDIYITAETAAITVGGTPQELDNVIFQVKRVPADASDTLTVDARLMGVRLFYTTNAANDL